MSDRQKAAELVLRVAADALGARTLGRELDNELDLIVQDWATRKTYPELKAALERQLAWLEEEA